MTIWTRLVLVRDCDANSHMSGTAAFVITRTDRDVCDRSKTILDQRLYENMMGSDVAELN